MFRYKNRLFVTNGSEVINRHILRGSVILGDLSFYIILDGYPASLGFPVMHRVHAICTQS